MARYKVLETSFINGRICEPGEEVDYAYQPGTNLEPLDAEAKAAAKKAVKTLRVDDAALDAMAPLPNPSVAGQAPQPGAPVQTAQTGDAV